MNLRVFQVQYRITNKDQTTDRDETKEFSSLSAAKKFLLDGLSKWDGNGAGIGAGQIVEEIRTPDENPELPFPLYYESERIATYVPEQGDKWYRYDDRE